MALTLGYKASAEQFGPQELLDFGVHAERCGFDSVLVSDHFQPWRHTGGHAPFSFAWLAALGARTERVLLGTSVVTPTLRYHPAVVAQAAGTLGCLFPGRPVLVALFSAALLAQALFAPLLGLLRVQTRRFEKALVDLVGLDACHRHARLGLQVFVRQSLPAPQKDQRSGAQRLRAGLSP